MKLSQKIKLLLSFDPAVRLRALNLFAGALLPGYRLTWHQLDWFADEEFTEFLRQFGENRGLNAHRKWTLLQLLRLTVELNGDTAECGVFAGASSWLICAANQRVQPGRTHHLFDSFEGLGEPDHRDGTYWSKGNLAASTELVRRNLTPFSAQLSFHKGWIPDRFDDVANRAFVFVHVDVDLYQPTLDSIAFFYDRLVDGGILVCDDYGFSSCPGATRAVDEFLRDKPEKMISLASGGGFMIRGRPASAPLSPLARGLEP